MKKPGAVIFDMDGVLVDTEPYHYENENLMFQQLGLDISDEEHARFTGVATNLMWQYILETRKLPYSLEELTEMTIKQGLGILQALENLPPLPGLVDLLEKLTAIQMPMAVATSSDAKTMEYILDKAGLQKYFQFTVCRNDVANSKPAPDVFLKAARLLGIKADDCVVVEDSLNGVKAAKAAGMFCIAYGRNGASPQIRQMADYCTASFSKLDNEIADW